MTGSGRPPVGRLAPSPTGRLHLGHARTFLLAFWHARSRGGALVMRMEDLDGARVVPGAADAILRDLEWLGLDWDGPVLSQSSRLSELSESVEELVRRGLAYPCICTRGDVQRAQSAPHGDSVEPRYPGTCRDRFTSVADAERSSGRPAGLRFRVPPGTVTFDDGLAGARTEDVHATVGDFLIARRGGAPAYQLAVVVDDAAQGVTEVVRGDDLLGSTPRQLLLQRALALPEPRYWHVPLVTDPEGRRLAKRSDDLALAELRSRGVDPRAVVAWAARTSGFSVPERIAPRELLAEFRMESVRRDPVAVGPLDLQALLDSSTDR